MSTHTLARQTVGSPPAATRPAVRVAHGTIRIETVRTLEGLARHREAWDRLATEAPQQIPTLTPVWVEAYFRHALPASQAWLCCFAYAGDRLVGVLPLVPEPHPLLGRRHPRLRTLRVGDFAPSGDIPLAPDVAGAALSALLGEADRAVPGHVGVAIQAVHEASPLWEAVRAGVTGYTAHAHARHRYSFVDTTRPLDDYMASLGNMRRNLKRYRKKLEAQGPVTVTIGREGAEDPALLDAFLTLEAGGWKGRNGTAILNHPDTTAFYRTLARDFAALGRWEWQVIRVDGRPVAAGMGIRCGRTVMLPKIAFDEDFSAAMPGNLLTEAVARAAFDDPETDALAHMSSAPWHESWRMDAHRYDDLYLVRRTLAATLFQRPWAGGLAFYKTKIAPRIPARLKQWRETLRSRRVRTAKEATSAETTSKETTSKGAASKDAAPENPAAKA